MSAATGVMFRPSASRTERTSAEACGDSNSVGSEPMWYTGDIRGTRAPAPGATAGRDVGGGCCCCFCCCSCCDRPLAWSLACVMADAAGAGSVPAADGADAVAELSSSAAGVMTAGAAAAVPAHRAAEVVGIRDESFTIVSTSAQALIAAQKGASGGRPA